MKSTHENLPSYLKKKLTTYPIILPLLFWEGIRMNVLCSSNAPSLIEHSEPGYFHSLNKTFFKYLTLVTDYELTCDFIEDLHNTCMNDVHNVSGEDHSIFSDNEINSYNGFGCALKDYNSHKKHKEFMAQCAIDLSIEYRNHMIWCVYFNGRHKVYFPFDEEYNCQGLQFKGIEYRNYENRATKKIIVSHFIEQYKQSIGSAIGNREKIACIIDFIQKIERFHPFADGNCRTFCMMLLNLELVKNGFLPTIQDDPNYFDHLSVEDLTSRVVSGQVKFKKLITSKSNDDLYDNLEQINFIDDKATEHNISMLWVIELSKELAIDFDCTPAYMQQVFSFDN